jgi:hypothetical protein
VKRQGIIYLVGALGSAAILVYVISLCLTAWDQSGLSSTFSILACVAGVFVFLFTLYGGLAFVFLARAVSGLVAAPEGVVLEPDSHARFKSVLVPPPILIRAVGAQFSSNEAEPKFAVFRAANKFWVAPWERFCQREARSDA